MNANPYRDFVAKQKHAVKPASVSAEQPTGQPGSIPAECGSGWYHDAAIKESQQAPARQH